MKRWIAVGLAVLSIGLSVFFLAIMRPPGGQTSAPGQDRPWQISRAPDGATISVFGLTLGQSTVRDAVAKFGRRYEFGLFESKDGQLGLEVYFRDAVIGGLSARLVLAARLPAATLNAIRAQVGKGKPTADGGRRYTLSEADDAQALTATITAITYVPAVDYDADLVRQRFGEPSERLKGNDGIHWLYPQQGLDLLLGDNGQALLQYVPPPEFDARLRMPLRTLQE